MTALAVTAAVLLLLGFTRAGVRAARTADGRVRVVLRVGFLRFDILKRLEKAEKKPAKAPKEAKEPEQKREGKRASDIRTLLIIGKTLLRKFFKAVRIDRLHFFLAVAGDPCDAALLYGRCNMAWGTLRPVLRRVLRIKKERVGFALDFEGDKTRWSGEIAVTISFGRMLGVGFALLGAVIKLRRTEQKREAV